jgi:hypothetical protein
MHRSRLFCAMAYLCLLLVAGCGVPAATNQPQQDTPQQVFLRAKTAAASHQWREYCELLTPQSRDYMAGALALSAIVIQGQAKMARTPTDTLSQQRLQQRAQRVGQVLDQHGLTIDRLRQIDGLDSQSDPRRAMQQLAASIADPTAFVSDMLDALRSFGTDHVTLANTHLVNVQVDADLARGELVSRVDGQEQKQPLGFERIDGQWKLSLAGPDSPREASTSATNRPVR